MKIPSPIIFGAVLLSGTQLLLPLGAVAQSEFTLDSFTRSTPSLNHFSVSQVDDFNPPDTGGPGRSGGSGTR